LDVAKALRDPRNGVGSAINDHGKQKGRVIGHVVIAFHCDSPLAAEVPLCPFLGSGRDQRDEQGAVLDLAADRLIPRIPSPKLALVEPDLNATHTQRVADALGDLGVLGGIA
jgi:hypothetical protein